MLFSPTFVIISASMLTFILASLVWASLALWFLSWVSSQEKFLKRKINVCLRSNPCLLVLWHRMLEFLWFLPWNPDQAGWQDCLCREVEQEREVNHHCYKTNQQLPKARQLHHPLLLVEPSGAGLLSFLFDLEKNFLMIGTSLDSQEIQLPECPYLHWHQKEILV